jgi:hypothetical protein
MMHFELSVNGEAVTRFEVCRQQQDAEGPGVHRYSWMSWRPPASLGRTLIMFTAHEVVHCEDDGIEALAYLVLVDWLRLRDKVMVNP